LNEASGIPFITGVDRVDKSSSTNATKKRTDSGVAGRNIMEVLCKANEGGVLADRSSRRGGGPRDWNHSEDVFGKPEAVRCCSERRSYVTI
jgi:hypothetical protein